MKNVPSQLPKVQKYVEPGFAPAGEALLFRQKDPKPGAPSMFNSLRVQVPLTTWWRWSHSEAQGRRREAGSEGSVEQRRGPMNKN